MAGRATVVALAAALLLVSGAGGASAQTPKRGGTIVVALPPNNEPACLRSWDAVCESNALWPFKVLARPYAEGLDRLTPELASDYELELDPFAVTYHIRPEARWSDGVSVSAQDFVFAHRTYLRDERIPEDDPFRTKIRRVHAVDAKTVRFVFRSRYGNWRSLLGRAPLPSHVLASADLASIWKDGIDNPTTGRPIGSGPFLVGRWERGKQVTLVRNPRYWGPHAAYLDRIVVRFVRVDLIGEALRSGEADLAGVQFPPPEDLRRDPELRMFSAPSVSLDHVEFRVGPGGHPALRDKLVRRALAYGIDRPAVVRAVFRELSPAPPLLNNTFFVPGERGYERNWSRYAFRLAESRRLLAQAGCRRGVDGIYLCGGERLRLRFLTTAGVAYRQRALELVQNQLRQVGVEVLPVYAANFGFLAAGDFDLALFTWFTKPAPGEPARSPYGCGDALNSSGYCSRLFTADLEELELIIDPARRAAVANRADRRLVGDVPTLPLFERPRILFARKTIHGYVPNGIGAVIWNAEDWWLER